MTADHESGSLDRPRTPSGIHVPDTCVCVDCGGTCYLGSYPPPEGWSEGDIVFYRCKDCLDRWDIVLELD